MDFLDLAKDRYSVRKFDNTREIEQEKLDKILEAGRVAPTAVNFQPQKVYVIKSEEALSKIKNQANVFDAPVVLLLCANMRRVWNHPLEDGYNTAEMDVSIVCTHMMLEAWNLGIGSVWIRYFNSEKVRQEFNLPENIKPICLLPIGYASKDCTPNEKLHFNRKDISETVEYL